MPKLREMKIPDALPAFANTQPDRRSARTEFVARVPPEGAKFTAGIPPSQKEHEDYCVGKLAT
jgi:hypothetical protein